ncbi:MAG: hypothetical protein ACYCRH_08165 [Acidiferrobacteraceae bacterium]
MELLLPWMLGTGLLIAIEPRISRALDRWKLRRQRRRRTRRPNSS